MCPLFHSRKRRTSSQDLHFLKTATVSLPFLLLILFFMVAYSFESTSEPTGNPDGELFTEITGEIGLGSDPAPWPDGTYALPEITGGGVALFDYDSDGDLDLLQVRFPPPGKPRSPAPNQLFEQQADGMFVDVTTAAGLGDPGYGQGVAIGDIDSDGDLDVYVTNFGPDAFFLNQGDGTFVDATSRAGFSGNHWSTSAAFTDPDRDGDLDLYVVHYVQFDLSTACRGAGDAPDYCGPQAFEPTLDTFYRNNGDGTFSDVTAQVGITSPGKGLGVVSADLTGDGWVDLYVANDGEFNQLWVNNRDGTFADEALVRGVAVNMHGQAEASMGVTAGDADGDGTTDLFMTHLTGETNTLYMASGAGILIDSSGAAGLSSIDLPYTGFGCGFLDFDNDGDLDLALVNGRVKRGPPIAGVRVGNFWSLYAEPNLLFENDGRGHFTDASSRAGSFAAQIEVSRGLAFGDIDSDGDIDLVVGNLKGAPRVFRNDAAEHAHWLLARVLDGKRDAIGAQVTLVAEGKRLMRLVLPGYSYISSNDPRVHFGLGATERVERIEILWPDGSRERFAVSGIDRELALRKGQGEALLSEDPLN